MLLKVKAANWLNFYWFLICCRILTNIPISFAFFEKAILDSGFTSLTNDKIYKPCSFNYKFTSVESNNFINTYTLYLTLVTIFYYF